MSDHHQISPTAWLVAKMRSRYTEIPYTKEIEEIINEPMNPFLMKLILGFVNFIVKYKPEKMAAINIIEGRYSSINDALPKKDFFLIELAAGLSPRGIQYSQKKGVTIVETDLPGLINIKEQVLERIYDSGKKPDNHHLFSINVMHKEELETIGKFYKKAGGGKPVYIIHEGMAVYLDPEEKEILRDNIAWFLRKYVPGKGYWITPDFSSFPKKAMSEEEAPWAYTFSKKILERVTRRKITSFRDEEEVNKFLAKSKLVSKRLSNAHLLPDMVTFKKMKLAPETGMETASEYGAFLIQPEEQLKKSKK